MDKLSESKCVPCEGGVPPLKGAQLRQYKKRLDSEAPGWELLVDDTHLGKTFEFPDFKTALDFVNKVGAIAEAVNHHPVIQLRWGLVRIITWTHAIDGLSENDFFLAAKISRELG